MKSKKVSADQGWHWYVCGWRLFVKNPGVLIGQLVVLLIAAIILNLLPVIGNLVLALITPVLAGGWYYTIRQLDNGSSISVGELFEGFRNKAWTGSLIVLGVMILATQMLLGLTAAGLLGVTFLTDVTALQAGITQLSLGFGGLLALSLVLLLSAALFTALFYAIPLVLFQEMAPIAALRSSFSASLQNWKPLLVYGLVYLVAALVAAIPLGLGFIVLIPVSVCAAFCSYKSVYE